MEWIIERYNWGELKGKITNYRRMCDLMVVLFIILLYIFLKTSEIPPLNIQFTKKYRELDIEKISPERIKLIKRHEVPMPKVQNENGAMAQPERAEIVDTDLLNRDVTSVINQHPNLNLLNVPKRPISQPIEPAILPDQLPPIQLEKSTDILHDNATQLSPIFRVEPTQVGQTVAINDVAVNQHTAGRNIILPHHSGSAIADTKISAESGQLDIQLISGEQAKKRSDISVIIDDLMEWMKRHPSQFIPVVRSFMMYETGDLTSRVTFQHRDRRFEFYLLYKPNRREIRICLVEGNQSTMLIDSGFKKQSNYLRTGSITRGTDREIFAFSTSQLPANEQKTMEFYQVFLTWWDQVKPKK
ncbi:MAG: hypothetical protein ONB31_09860 [candidate division KSB1 bacterium]|nr:hypothetical protein [candidate division KSB1 bacterium]MDZ7335490.1 hypothetical protein [candidate division KSB1 bacterium]